MVIYLYEDLNLNAGMECWKDGILEEFKTSINPLFPYYIIPGHFTNQDSFLKSKKH